MSHFINTSSSSNIFSLLLRLNNLIENDFVINHISISNYHLENSNIIIEDNKNIPSHAVNLKAQFQKLYDSEKYQITIFDTYGKKKNVSNFDNKRDFRKAFYNYANGKLFSLRFNHFGKFNKYKKDYYKEECLKFDYTKVLTYHKQRISKKLTSNVFVSNEKDLKIEVYKWLLKKNKDAVIIPEYTIGNRRADYISFDDKKIDCTIVEIKSELDTFERLEAQLDTYSKIANNIYLAIDKKQYEKLQSKNITVPGHIGLLIFDNSKRKKLDEVKKAARLDHKKDYQFIPFLSYSDINNSFVGFKYSSKLSKEQKEIFIEQNINKEIINRFAYDVLCNRFVVESDKRKEFFKNKDIDNAVASSKEIKINRFDNGGKYSMTLHSYIEDKDILYKYFIIQETKLLQEFKVIPNFKDYIKNGSENLENLVTYIRNETNSYYINGLSNSNIFKGKSTINIGNQLDFLEFLIKNKELVINYIKGEQ
ncbi:sce7726 family protein [Aliarcobacter butzleri]|uniref:sce7726 family protein n=1 Tax=Aliarcobacter butzleri TaxID=28197 RepID=UPI0021B5EF50|nr:sce7726 family protein [Aliarcobacter butzleri]MCT7578671.1 sce7726 family protein [Aliarcobacter butzleri]